MRFAKCALAGTVLLFGAVVALPEEVHPVEVQAPKDGKEVRARVKAGALRPCVSESVTDMETQPVITFNNHCSHQANVMLCVNIPGREPVHYMLLISSRAKVLHRLWNTGGKPFTYNYNVCDKPYCTPPESEC